MNCISAMGRMPMSAAPMAAPTMADSLMGVSMTRLSPKLLEEAGGDAEGAAVGADVLADDEDAARPAPSPRAWPARMASR